MGGCPIGLLRSVVVALAIVGGCSKARQPAGTGAQVPADAVLVATVSLDKLRASPQWPKLEAALAAKLPLAEIKQSCPTDPVKSIQSITVALPKQIAPDRALVLVRGVARDAAESCAKSLAAAQNQMLTVGEEGGLAAYRQGAEAIYASWLDGKTVAIAPGALTSKFPFDGFGVLGTPKDPVLAEGLAKVQGDHLVTIAFSAPAQSELAAVLGQSGLEPEAGYGWIDLDPTLRGQLVARFATAERAASAVAQVQSQSPLAKLKATQRDREVTFNIELDATETAQVIDQLVSAAR